MSDSAPDHDDERWMALALEEAREALAHGDVPVGAVVVHEGRVVARRHNERTRDQDPTAHAEVLAVRDAATALCDWRLDGCTIYVTLEPCTMCAGSLVASRMTRVVYGAADLKAGAVQSLYGIGSDPRLHHQFDLRVGVLADESSELLTAFFRRLRDPDGPRGTQHFGVASTDR
jgi:tRNA(adenine34) deaminase